MGIPRMRIATDVLAEIKALDPDTRITLHYIRSIINQGKVPVRKAGSKKQSAILRQKKTKLSKRWPG